MGRPTPCYPARTVWTPLHLSLVALASLGLASAVRAEEGGSAGVIQDGSQVSLEYSLTSEDGEVADSNVGGEPLVYKHGESQLLPALEGQLRGMARGDSKKITLTPEQAYGAVDPSLFQTVPASAIPEEARKVGAELMAHAPDGMRRPVRVREVREEEIVLDLNHPLAGKTLHFDIRVLGIE